jgi:hypothetical protein
VRQQIIKRFIPQPQFFEAHLPRAAMLSTPASSANPARSPHRSLPAWPPARAHCPAASSDSPTAGTPVPRAAGHGTVACSCCRESGQLEEIKHCRATRTRPQGQAGEKLLRRRPSSEWPDRPAMGAPGHPGDRGKSGATLLSWLDTTLGICCAVRH